MKYTINEFKFSKNALHSLKSLKKNEQKRVLQTLINAKSNIFLTHLRFHKLNPKYKNHFSISAGGDIRIHFEYQQYNIAYIIAIGSHSKLYK